MAALQRRQQRRESHPEQRAVETKSPRCTGGGWQLEGVGSGQATRCKGGRKSVEELHAKPFKTTGPNQALPKLEHPGAVSTLPRVAVVEASGAEEESKYEDWGEEAQYRPPTVGNEEAEEEEEEDSDDEPEVQIPEPIVRYLLPPLLKFVAHTL
jgi:hypothetical protein